VGEQFESQGGRFAPGARYPGSTTDYTQYLNQLDEQVDAFQDFFGLSSVAIYTVAFDEINDIFAQAQNYSRLTSVRWYGSDGSALNSSLLQNETTAAFMSATQMLSPIFAGDLNSPEFQRVRSLIEEDVGERVKPYAVVAYDCVLLLAEAWKSLGSTEVGGLDLRDEIIRISSTITGASGNLALDATGDRIHGDYELWQIVSDENGGYDWKLGATLDVPETGFVDGVFTAH
jgi:ABC-type branched-subunit amino acid transport system substrate-binding protein